MNIMPRVGRNGKEIGKKSDRCAPSRYRSAVLSSPTLTGVGASRIAIAGVAELVKLMLPTTFHYGAICRFRVSVLWELVLV